MRQTKISGIKQGWILAVSVVASVVFAAAINRPVFAEEKKQDCDNSSSVGITVQTPTKRISLKPDTVYEGSVRVKNNACEILNFRVEATPFAPSTTDYANTFDKQNKWTQISRFITFTETEFTLKVGEHVDVEYIIKTPAKNKIAAGGQYAAIAIIGESERGSDGVKITPRVMYPIYGRVDGEVRDEAKITVQSIPFWTDGFDRNKNKEGLVTKFAVDNTGNVDFAALGKITVKGFFGGTIYETPDKSRTQVFAFPETTPPAKEVSWKDARIGVYWVTQDVEINGETTSKTRLVIVCPFWLLITTIIGIAAVIFLIVHNIVRRRKNKKERSVKK